MCVHGMDINQIWQTRDKSKLVHITKKTKTGFKGVVVEPYADLGTEITYIGEMGHRNVCKNAYGVNECQLSRNDAVRLKYGFVSTPLARKYKLAIKAKRAEAAKVAYLAEEARRAEALKLVQKPVAIAQTMPTDLSTLLNGVTKQRVRERVLV